MEKENNQKTNAVLEFRFDFHELTEERKNNCQQIREKAKELAYLIDKNISSESREKSLALTKLEEVVMWANAGISRQ